MIYPAERGDFPAERVAEAIKAVGLPALVERLDEEAHWNRMLSLGEQQRLGIARALLHAPDYLFLDEATASLDEASEAALYKLLHERLAGSTIVSIGHRSTLTAFHKRRLQVRARPATASRSKKRARARLNEKGGSSFKLPPNSGRDVRFAYLSAASVVSNLSETMKVSSHQLFAPLFGADEQEGRAIASRLMSVP